MPAVSFIVPAFNEAAHLPACLASIREQMGDFEVIVVDNNSNDGTAKIALHQADRVVRCADQGIAAARNCGAASAYSGVLAFVDADAVLCADWLSRGFNHLQSGRFDALCGWNYFAEENPLRFCFYNTYSFGFIIFSVLRTIIGRRILAGNNLLIRKAPLESAGGFPRLIGEDLKLSALLNAGGCRLGFCPQMRIAYSARRFRRQGFFRVLGLWLSTLARDLPEEGYAVDYAFNERGAGRSDSALRKRMGKHSQS